MSRISLSRMSPTKIAWIALAAVVAVLVALTAAVAIGAFIAQKELRAAVPIVSQIQDEFGSDDRATLSASVQELQGHAAAARGAADTPLWWIAEQAPFVGPTLHAVRESTVAVDELAQGVLPTLADVDPALLRPTGGAFDVAAIGALAGPVSTAAAAGENAADALAGVDLADTPGVLRGPLAQLTGGVKELQPALSRVNALMPHLPSMMGQDGPKNYLLLVQNNAEARGLGGIPASVVMLRLEGGKMEIVQQAASGDFTNKRASPIIPLDSEVVKLYDDKIGRWSQDATSTPDFSLAADLSKAFWTETFGTQVDGVIAIDPIVLSYILKATGPITLATGDKLTSSDAVRVLLSDVYARYPKNVDQDKFFASAAVEIFDAVSSGDFKPVPFVTAVVQSVDENRVYFHSFDTNIESAFDGSRLSGPLPKTDGADEATVGVFVNDLTEGKLSFYTWMSADLVVDRCAGAPTYTATVTFVNALDQATSDGLVSYVNGGRHYPKGVIGTDLQFYGPSGARFVGATIDGSDVAITTGEHLGRPVGRMWVVNGLQEAHTMTMTFEGGPEHADEAALVHTPMVNPVRASVTEKVCG